MDRKRAETDSSAALVAAEKAWLTRFGGTASGRSSVVLASALLGDALLYLVLPVEAATFGVSSVWVGLLLSSNRFVRLGVNAALVPLEHRIGLGGLARVGAVLATISTLGYAVLAGAASLLLMRLIWGIGYSALRLAYLGFATEEPAGAPRRLGYGHALVQVGPLLAGTAGVWMVDGWGMRPAMAVLGLLTAAGIVLAGTLPRSAPRGASAPIWRWRDVVPPPGRLDVIAFLVSLAVEGVFLVSLTMLLVEEGHASAAAIKLGGVVLVVRRIGAVVLSPFAGHMADRWGVARLFRLGLSVLGLGFLSVALGVGVAGLVAVACLTPVVQALIPGVATEQATQNRLPALTRLTVWTDLGAAVGALAAGSLAGLLGVHLLFAAAGLMVVAGLMMENTPARLPISPFPSPVEVRVPTQTRLT